MGKARAKGPRTSENLAASTDARRFEVIGLAKFPARASAKTNSFMDTMDDYELFVVHRRSG